MKAQIKQWFETLTWQFLKDFLPNCPQDAPPFLAPALPNPPILLSGLPGTSPASLTFRIFCLISSLDTLTLDTLTPDTRSACVPPILHANHPILHGNHPILHSNHPIQRGNHPMFPAWGPLLQTLCTARLSSPKSVHCSLSTASGVARCQGGRVRLELERIRFHAKAQSRQGFKI